MDISLHRAISPPHIVHHTFGCSSEWTSKLVFKLLTFTYVSHLQILVSADTGVSKHRVVHPDSTAVFPITAVDAEWHEWIQAWMHIGAYEILFLKVCYKGTASPPAIRVITKRNHHTHTNWCMYVLQVFGDIPSWCTTTQTLNWATTTFNWCACIWGWKMPPFFDPFVDFPFSLIDLRNQESQFTYLPEPITNWSFDLFLTFNKERATVPVSNFAWGVWAVDVFNLRGRPFVRACGLVTTSIVGTIDKYNLPFVWKEEGKLARHRGQKCSWEAGNQRRK